MAENKKKHPLSILFYTSVALMAFAANSVLCRSALGETFIDAAGFTIIRLISGAAVLLLILKFNGKKGRSDSHGSWISAASLFTYAITFSYAYITLQTGTGALILFGAVQLTMISGAILAGKRLRIHIWSGVVFAFSGLLYLVFPGLKAPTFAGALLMTVSGIAWGIYSLKGRRSQNPLSDTTFNFLRSLLFVAILFLFSFHDFRISLNGFVLAVLSGAIASGIGYSIWYAALRGLSATRAGIVQLLVPVLAAFGGVIFISEKISAHLIISSVIILGGIGLTFLKGRDLETIDSIYSPPQDHE